MDQPYPRKCTECGKLEGSEDNENLEPEDTIEGLKDIKVVLESLHTFTGSRNMAIVKQRTAIIDKAIQIISSRKGEKPKKTLSGYDQESLASPGTNAG